MTDGPTQSYADRLSHELTAFGGREGRRYSDFGTFYARNYKWPRLAEVTGCANAIEFYVNHFAERLRARPDGRLVSIGSGDAKLEIKVARRLRGLGLTEFGFDCLEISPERNTRARGHAKAAGLESCLRFVECDFNEWRPEHRYSGVMAHYALHHVMNLEGLFDAVRSGLEADGVFVTVDTVGRNGHQRWPETLEVVQRLWATLPADKKRHAFNKKTFERFPNIDLSRTGFEGIRAQDILPLLVRNFQFETFVAFGGLTDVFINPTWGANFSPDDAQDRAFLDLVHYLNDVLIDLGQIKPTQIFAAMSLAPKHEPRIHRQWTPSSA